MKKRWLSLLLALTMALSLALPASAADDAVSFSNINGDMAKNGPTQYKLLTLGEDKDPVLVEKITTYHWNDGLGTEKAGSISIIEYRMVDGNWKEYQTCGTWQATGRNYYGLENIYWDAYPNFTMQPGHAYIVKPSDRSTWSYNETSKNCGMFELTGRYVKNSGGSGINVTVNGSAVRWTDAAPFIDSNNRTMVPLRAVADALGLTVNWDGNTRTASFSDGANAIYFAIGSKTARTGGGGMIQMDTAAVIRSDRTYAPIRYLAEFFGYSVGWDGNTRTVSLTSGSTSNADRPSVPGTGDFAWTDEVPSDWSSMPRGATALKKASDCSGEWKAQIEYIDYDGTPVSTELLNITITPSLSKATVTLNMLKINFADESGWRDESNSQPSTWDCKKASVGDSYGLSGEKLDGAMTLGPFWSMGGNMQYGVGIMYLPDGSIGRIALVRP